MQWDAHPNFEEIKEGAGDLEISGQVCVGEESASDAVTDVSNMVDPCLTLFSPPKGRACVEYAFVPP